MQAPFTEQEFDKFADIFCEKYKGHCENCLISNDCMEYSEFECGFALNDKEIIQKGLRIAQKMNNIKFTVYEIAKIPIKNFDTLEEAEKYVDRKGSNKNYIIELTES